jgi:hypothetical protein
MNDRIVADGRFPEHMRGRPGELRPQNPRHPSADAHDRGYELSAREPLGTYRTSFDAGVEPRRGDNRLAQCQPAVVRRHMTVNEDDKAAILQTFN